MRPVERKMAWMILLIILILPTSAQTPKRYSEIDPIKAKDRHIGECKDIGTGWKRHWNTECAEPFQHYQVVDLAGEINESKEALLDRLEAEREAKLDEKGHYILRSEILPSMSETSQPTKENSINWCSIPGNYTSKGEACELCEATPDNFYLPRAYLTSDRKHMCVCHKWGQGPEQFMACNCDLCDALMISSGLRKQCQEMQNDRNSQGYLSAYTTLEDHNAFFKRYNDENGVGEAPDYLVGDVLKYQSTCKSGLQGKTYEDHKGHILTGDIRPDYGCYK